MPNLPSLRNALASLRTGVRCRDAHRIPNTLAGPAYVCTITDDEGHPLRVLWQGGAYQSATYLGERRFELPFRYYRGFDVLFGKTRPDARVLMVGGGGCSYSKYAIVHHPQAFLDVVENDPAIIAAARDYFFVDELLARPDTAGRLNLIASDGRVYVDEAPAGAYDAVINDSFAGSVPVPSLSTVEAALSVRRCLRPQGLYLANVVSADEGRDIGFVRDCVSTLSEVFSFVHVVLCADDVHSDEDNYLLIATDAHVDFPGEMGAGGDFPGRVLRDGRV